MQVTVNGQPMEVEEGTNLEALLARLRVKREFTAVAVNREVAPRSAYVTTLLRDGDRLEIVHPMGGG
ncbi:MAG: sulfur carrier protein ThiS [Candidatus Rokubacteria bacterium]|nr:sulfur carrier protein ThiS [Candidatus Rokubacteria bacterium]